MSYCTCDILALKFSFYNIICSNQNNNTIVFMFPRDTKKRITNISTTLLVKNAYLRQYPYSLKIIKIILITLKTR